MQRPLPSLIKFFDGIEDVAALMVSYDLPFAHARFAEQNELKNVIGLSAIRHAGFGENYGVQIVDGPLAGMFSRAVVVLDENNTIVHHEQIEDITKEPDYDAALRALGIENSGVPMSTLIFEKSRGWPQGIRPGTRCCE